MTYFATFRDKLAFNMECLFKHNNTLIGPILESGCKTLSKGKLRLVMCTAVIDVMH